MALDTASTKTTRIRGLTHDERRLPGRAHVGLRRLLRRLRHADRRQRGRPPTAAPPAPADVADPGAGQAPAGQTCPNCSTPNVAGRAVLRDLRLRLHHRHHAAAAAPARPSRDRAVRRRAAPPTIGAAPVHRPGVERPSTGWPRSGSTRPGTRLRRAPTRCPRPGCPRSSRCAAARCWSAGRPGSRNIHPEIDCESDSGVSRRQAQLTTDGHPLVGGGPRVGQRHLRRPGQRRAARGPDPGRRQARARPRRPGLRRRLDPAGDPAGHRRRASEPRTGVTRSARTSAGFPAIGGTVATSRWRTRVAGSRAGMWHRCSYRPSSDRHSIRRIPWRSRSASSMSTARSWWRPPSRPPTSRRRSGEALSDDGLLHA